MRGRTKTWDGRWTTGRRERIDDERKKLENRRWIEEREGLRGWREKWEGLDGE